MKRTIVNLFLAGILTLSITSCKDDGPVFGDAQSAIAQFVASLTYDDAYVDDSNYEFGCAYRINKAGRITKLCCKMPDDGSYKLTLWSLSDSSIIAQVTVVADSGTTVYGDITDVDVEAGDEFAVTIYSNDYYIWDDGIATIYPATFGDITILGYGYIWEPTGTQFPDEFYDDYYAGISDLVFEPLIE